MITLNSDNKTIDIRFTQEEIGILAQKVENKHEHAKMIENLACLYGFMLSGVPFDSNTQQKIKPTKKKHKRPKQGIKQARLDL